MRSVERIEISPTFSLSPPLGEACEHYEQGGELYRTECPHPNGVPPFDLPEGR
jgi:hypothetical protein